jgi:2-polyprenyl-3-methyl-5-hydroxy-6-metoxy-1,4-benzoquinol methylase
VGGTGAIITFGITWILTEQFGMWYMASMVIAVAIATIWNYNFNLLWTFKTFGKFTDANYEWESFYNGNPIQQWWKHSIAETVWKWIPPTNGDKILDFGCGSSPIISKYKNATGIDSNLKKLKFMQEKCPSVKFNYAIFDREFDNILCIEVLEHIVEPEDTIAYLCDYLRIGGKMVIATPDYKKKLWILAEKFTPYKTDHFSKLDKGLLERMCARHNLFPINHTYIAGCDLIEMFEKRA